MPTLTSVTKHFPKTKEGFITTLSSTIASGAAIVPLNSVTGYTNGDTIVLIVDPGNSSKQAVTGVVDTVGVRLTSAVWTEGTNTTHSNGATVVDYVSATHSSMLAKGMLVDHEQDGRIQGRFNVKNYSATGDGTTDDTTYIQAAIDAASAAGGGTVFFPKGTYKVTSALNLKSYVTLKGVAGGAWDTSKGSIIKTTSNSINVLYYTSAGSGIVSAGVEDLRIEGPATAGTGRGIYLANGGGSNNPHVNVMFRNLKVVGFGTGIEVVCLIVSKFDNVTCETCTTGFYLNGGAAFATPNTSITMDACYANGCQAGTGFNIRSTVYSTFNAPAADDCGTAYLIDTCNNLSFQAPGCEWANPTTASPADGYKITGSHQIVMNAPYTFQNKHYSFWITGTSLNVILISPSENTPLTPTNSIKTDVGSTTSIYSMDFTTARSDAGQTFYINDGGGGLTIPSAGYLYSNGPVTSAGLFTMFGGILNHKTAVTTTYSVLATDGVILCSASGGAFTATLPTAVGREGQTYTLKKTDSTTNAVTIATTSSQTIDGALTVSLATQYDAVTVFSDNANWHII